MQAITLLIFAVTLLVHSCARVVSFTGQTPIVDMKGVDPHAYAADLTDCLGYAAEVHAGRQSATGAGGGAVPGGARGGSNARNDRRAVVRNCLIGRDYYVLN